MITLSGLIVFYWRLFPGRLAAWPMRTTTGFLPGGLRARLTDRGWAGRRDGLDGRHGRRGEALGEETFLAASSCTIRAMPPPMCRSVDPTRTPSPPGRAWRPSTAATGELLHHREAAPGHDGPALHRRPAPDPVRHWTLRWLISGWGSRLRAIATGYLFWLESRRKRHGQLGLRGVPVVEGLTIGSVTGIVVATLGLLRRHRLLPLGDDVPRPGACGAGGLGLLSRGSPTFAHAWLRPGRAWIEQCWTIAALAVAPCC